VAPKPSSGNGAHPPQARATVAGEALTMPFGDLTVSEGKIVRWLKKVGDPVKAGELVVEIETDKAVVEVEATATGKLAQILEQAGTVVKMGQQIAVVAPV
jgi:2-oxoisovalerate dehydrogenase E1 component